MKELSATKIQVKLTRTHRLHYITLH